MGQPKISGNLFNCAFNCALPTLLEKIQLLAEMETNNHLPDESDSIYSSYNTLKVLFAQCYGLSEEETFNFTWNQWNSFLSPYLFSAKEILFAPVFRLFIEKNRQKAIVYGLNLLNPDSIETTELGIDVNTGKYIQIDADVLKQVFYHPLGINTEILKRNPETQNYDRQRSFVPNKPFLNNCLQYNKTLQLYLDYDGGHYELQPHAMVSNDIYFGETDSFINALEEVHKATSEDMHAGRTTHAIAALFIEVNKALNSKLLQDAQNLQIYADNGRQAYSSDSKGTLTFAAVLLAIAFELYKEDGKERFFYQSLQDALEYLGDHNEPEAIQFAERLIKFKCEYEALQQDVEINEIQTTHAFFQERAANVKQLQNDQNLINSKKSNQDTVHKEPSIEINPFTLQTSTANQSKFSSSSSSSFELKWFDVLLGVGASLLIVAIVTLPPLAALIGVTAIIPVGVAGLVSSATAVSGLSLLGGLGLFACSKKIRDDGQPSLVLQLG